MSPLLLPLTPRFVTLTLATLAAHLDKCALLSGTVNARWNQPWAMADPHSFRAVA